MKSELFTSIPLPEYSHIELSNDEKELAKYNYLKRNYSGYLGVTVDDLTQTEVNEAYRVERGRKQGRINEIEYAKKVNQQQREIPITAEYLYEGLKRHFTYLHGTFVDTHGRDKVYQNLCYYFTNDNRFNGDLKKGLLIRGEIGCGKTTMMEFFRKGNRKFNIVPCRKISFEYKDKGPHAIIMFGKNSSNFPLVGTCFDDLGTETNTKNFGDSLNVMAEVILMRYETKSVNTFITTNLTDAQILSGYEARVFDRIKEMFNVINLPGESLR